MAPPFNRICSKAEDAFKAVVELELDTNLTGVQVVVGFTGNTKLQPRRVHIICPRATPWCIDDMIFTGNWWVDFEITAVTNYQDNTRAQREALAAELFDIILQKDLPEKLNNIGNVEDFHAYGSGQNQSEFGLVPAELVRDVDGDSYFEVLTGRLLCRPSTGEA